MDQGLHQGRAAQTAVRRAALEARKRAGWFSWSRECRRAARIQQCPTAQFLPQLAERERGIALGADLRPAALAGIARSQIIRASGVFAAGALYATLDDEAFLGSLLFRVTDPDQVGLRSLELTAPAWAGCWAGVNEAGVAIVVLHESSGSGPRAALYAQDLLFRASDAASAVTHLRTRASYARGSGRLLLADVGGTVLRLDVISGSLTVSAVAPLEPTSSIAQLVVSPASRELRFRGESISL